MGGELYAMRVADRRSRRRRATPRRTSRSTKWGRQAHGRPGIGAADAYSPSAGGRSAGSRSPAWRPISLSSAPGAPQIGEHLQDGTPYLWLRRRFQVASYLRHQGKHICRPFDATPISTSPGRWISSNLAARRGGVAAKPSKLRLRVASSLSQRLAVPTIESPRVSQALKRRCGKGQLVKSRTDNGHTRVSAARAELSRPGAVFERLCREQHGG